jgi:hypothetical protein
VSNVNRMVGNFVIPSWEVFEGLSQERIDLARIALSDFLQTCSRYSW